MIIASAAYRDNPCCGALNVFIWVNYNISLTWIKAIWGWFPLLTMIPVRSQWGRYNLPRFILQKRGCFPNPLCNSAHKPKPANLLVKGDSLLTQQSVASLASLTIEHSIEHSMASTPAARRSQATRLATEGSSSSARGRHDSSAAQWGLPGTVKQSNMYIMYIVYNNYVNIYIMLIYIYKI